MSINALTISGNLTKDAELRYSADGKSICSFTVANNQGWGDREHTEYYQCAVFGNRAEKLASHLTLGTKVFVTGEHKTEKREHNGSIYFNNKVFVKDIDMPTTQMGSASQRAHQPPAQPTTGQVPTGGGAESDFDDDIPF